MNETVFNIKPIPLKNQKPDDGGTITLELAPKYVRYAVQFYASEPKNIDDHSLGWETVYNNFETVVHKSTVVGFDKSYMPESNQWSIYIFVNGMSGDIKIFFKKKSEAQEVFDQLFNYLYA